METLNIFANELERDSVNLAKYSRVEIGLITEGSYSGAQLTLVQEESDRYLDPTSSSFDIKNGDIIRIVKHTPKSAVKKLFDSKNISLYEEMYQESNMGNFCKKHIQFRSDYGFKNITYIGESSKALINLEWKDFSYNPNVSIVCHDNFGTEQWSSFNVKMENAVEFLYIENKPSI